MPYENAEVEELRDWDAHIAAATPDRRKRPDIRHRQQCSELVENTNSIKLPTEQQTALSNYLASYRSGAVPCRLAAEANDEKINKGPYICRQMPTRRIQCVQRLLGRRIVGQQPDEPACSQIVAYKEGRDQNNPAASESGGAQDIGVVGEIPPRDGHDDLGVCRIPKTPFAAALEIGVL